MLTRLSTILCAAWLLVTGTLVSLPAHAAELQTGLDRIAESWLLQETRTRFPDAQITVTVTAPDSRLRLHKCDELELARRGQQEYGRLSVAVSCRKGASWSLFLAARVSVARPVLVAATALPRGTVLTAEHLSTRTEDLSALRRFYLEAPGDAIGMALSRAVAAHSVLYLNQLQAPVIVHRGEQVTILASRGSIRIAAPGESLQDGRFGEQIRVKNVRSNKIIAAWVSKPGLVTVYPLAPPPADQTAYR